MNAAMQNRTVLPVMCFGDRPSGSTQVGLSLISLEDDSGRWSAFHILCGHNAIIDNIICIVINNFPSKKFFRGGFKNFFFLCIKYTWPPLIKYILTSQYQHNGAQTEWQLCFEQFDFDLVKILPVYVWVLLRSAGAVTQCSISLNQPQCSVWIEGDVTMLLELVTVGLSWFSVFMPSCSYSPLATAQVKDVPKISLLLITSDKKCF